MGTIHFIEPNFRARVTKGGSSTREWYVFLAETEAAARAHLEQEGFTVHQLEGGYDFKTHNERKIDVELKCYRNVEKCPTCEEKGREKHKSLRPLWGELKDHLFDLFHQKCAYCEATVKHVAHGDVEHYRPKGKVTEDERHPGYYWLAYEPSNYLPSCQLCNQGDAKGTHFPIAGTRAYTRADPLPAELPLLLNPYEDDYSEHLAFYSSDDVAPDKKPGEAFSDTDKGKKTIELLKLNREVLVDDRYKAQRYGLVTFKASITTDPAEITKLAIECLDGEQEYATAVMNEINKYCEKNPYLRSPFEEP